MAAARHARLRGGAGVVGGEAAVGALQGGEGCEAAADRLAVGVRGVLLEEFQCHGGAVDVA